MKNLPGQFKPCWRCGRAVPIDSACRCFEHVPPYPLVSVGQSEYATEYHEDCDGAAVALGFAICLLVVAVVVVGWIARHY